MLENFMLYKLNLNYIPENIQMWLTNQKARKVSGEKCPFPLFAI